MPQSTNTDDTYYVIWLDHPVECQSGLDSDATTHE
jgi:hypothetical protein